jgi:hypothetical protein
VTGCAVPFFKAICLFFLRFRNHIPINANTSNPAIPPTTPPMIAVLFELEEEDDVDVGFEGLVCVDDENGD